MKNILYLCGEFKGSLANCITANFKVKNEIK